MTKTERVIAILLERGETEIVPSPSRKYRQFTHHVNPDVYYWVGKSGGLRVGRTSSASYSVAARVDAWLAALAAREDVQRVTKS